MNPDFEKVGQEFVKAYYVMFDSNRASLAALYTDVSMLTFEGQQFQGTQNIMKKITELPFKVVQHIITTVDCQPSGQNGVLVFVVGQLKTDDDPPHSFSQTFQLFKKDTNNYFVLNDMFRLSLHHG